MTLIKRASAELIGTFWLVFAVLAAAFPAIQGKTIMKPNTILAPAALLLALGVFGCGGPLEYTVDGFDINAVAAEKRSEIDAKEAAVAEAKSRLESSRSAVESAEDAVDSAEAAVTKREDDLEIAQAKLNLEETKEDADRAANVEGAESSESKAEQALKVAKASLEVAERKLDLAEATATEAEKAWLVALAELELAKSQAKGDASPQQAQLEQQLAEHKTTYAEAQEERVGADKELKEAVAELTEAKGG